MATVIGQSAQAAVGQVPLQAGPPQAVSVHSPAEVVALAQEAASGQLPLSEQAVAWLQAEPDAQAAVALGHAWQSLVALAVAGQVLPSEQAVAWLQAEPDAQAAVALGHAFPESSAQPINTAADIPTTSTTLVISFFIRNSPYYN